MPEPLNEKENNSPLIKSLNDSSGAVLFSNSEGSIMIAHNKEIPDSIQWVEYDAPSNTLSIIHKDGKVQDLGLKIDKKTQKNLIRGTKILIAYIVNAEVKSAQNALIIVREY